MPVDTTTSPDKVVLSIGTTSAEIYYYGATVTSWKLNGDERLFVSKSAVLDGTKAIRGGIPLVFPQFGKSDHTPKLPQHGFARTTRWRWLGVSADTASEISVRFALGNADVDPALLEAWAEAQPGKVVPAFQATYTVALGPTTLKSHLAIQNTGTAPWDFTALLHTYLAVGAIGDVSVTGLQGVRYVDKVADGAEATETRESITVDGEVDRVYVDVKTSPSTRLAVVEKTPGRPTVSVHRSALPDVVVWNPWTEKARAMGDFDDDEYRTMICVEAGHVATPYTLPAGETWTASQTLAV